MAIIDLLTGNYLLSPEVVDLQRAINHVMDFLIAEKGNLFNQFNVETATWGLAEWEKYIGLDTDLSKSYEFRRERICAKLRGRGTTTKQMIKDVSIAYSNGKVEVIELPQEYKFIVKFTGVKGVPPNMADLTLTIEEIKPAHLTYVFEYTYLTWDEFERYNNVWDEWDLLGLTWNEFETYKGGA